MSFLWINAGFDAKQSATNAMWKGERTRLEKAKNQARMARNRKDYLATHSIMLSAYISIAGSKDYNRLLHPIFALWHARCLCIKWERLNHNQLDVLVQFMLKLPFWLRPNHLLSFFATREVKLAQDSEVAKPHQKALSYLTFTEVISVINFEKESVLNGIHLALSYEEEIRAEPDQPQGLRQLVRIFRKVGELYTKKEMVKIGQAKIYLIKAIILATEEANCADQVPKIKAILDSL